MTNAKGQCLCGTVRFSVAGSFGEVRYCHCSSCRQTTGTAFSANAKIPLDNWSITHGQGSIAEYEQVPGIFRAFCNKCGSPVYARLDADPKNIRVRLGGFEGDLDVNITGHVWLGSKASWYRIKDELPCYMESIDSEKCE